MRVLSVLAFVALAIASTANAQTSDTAPAPVDLGNQTGSNDSDIQANAYDALKYNQGVAGPPQAANKYNPNPCLYANRCRGRD
jgi:hypothetical protein